MKLDDIKSKINESIEVELPFTSDIPDLDAEALKVFVNAGKAAFITWWEHKIAQIEAGTPAAPAKPERSIAERLRLVLDVHNMQKAREIIGDGKQLNNEDRAAMRQVVTASDASDDDKKEMLRKIGGNKGHWVKESEFNEIVAILKEHNLSWKDLGVSLVHKQLDLKRVIIL